MSIINTAKTHFPQMKIVARAIDRRHNYELLAVGIDGIQRETFHSALNLGTDALQLLGLSSASAKRAGEIFEQHDENTLRLLAQHWGDDRSYGAATRQRTEDLRQVLQSDARVSAEQEAS